MKMISNYFL